MKLINFLVCDDIRVEIANKHSIIGLYDDEIKFPVCAGKKDVWPKAIKMGIFIKTQFESDKEIDTIKNFQLEASFNGKKKVLAKGPFKMNEKEKAKGINLAAVFEPFSFESAGTLELKIVFFNDANEIVSELERPEKIIVSEI